jgi:hypothetical protein
MIIKDTESVDVHTSTGPMRTYLFRPVAEGRYPGLLLKNNSYAGTKGKATGLLSSPDYTLINIQRVPVTVT